jgi:hypothetical protein
MATDQRHPPAPLTRTDATPADLINLAQRQNVELIRSPDGTRLYVAGPLRGHTGRRFCFAFESFDQTRRWLTALAARRAANAETAGGAP